MQKKDEIDQELIHVKIQEMINIQPKQRAKQNVMKIRRQRKRKEKEGLVVVQVIMRVSVRLKVTMMNQVIMRVVIARMIAT